QYTLQDQGIFDSGCSRNMIGYKSFLRKYQEIDGGFVAFGGSPKGGKITGDLTCLFAKATIDESNLWHRRLGHINFKTLNKLVRSPNLEFMRPFGCHVTILNTLDHLGKFDGKADEGFLVGYYSSDVNAGDQPGDVNAGDIKGDVDEISKNDDVCQRNEIRIDSSTHVVNAASTSINTASNIIVVGSLNTNISDSNHTNMSTLETTGIFDGAFDDKDLGAEANTNNLDSSTVVSPIPTIRVHKDHLKEQIIGDPNLNTQTRRMINFFKETAMHMPKIVLLLLSLQLVQTLHHSLLLLPVYAPELLAVLCS
nr:ribonuclease H-like domain-containing protein [Tanacetum cinerariifolium]